MTVYHSPRVFAATTVSLLVGFSTASYMTDWMQLDCQLGNWIIMPPPTSMSQVNGHLRLSAGTRRIPLLTLPPGTERART